MPNVTDFLLPLLRHLLKGEVRSKVEHAMTNAEPSIVAGMHLKGMEPPHAGVGVCARDAMFRLWKAVVKSGDVSDLIRDSQASAVVPKVVAALVGQTPTLAQIVTVTRESILDETFGD